VPYFWDGGAGFWENGVGDEMAMERRKCVDVLQTEDAMKKIPRLILPKTLHRSTIKPKPKTYLETIQWYHVPLERALHLIPKIACALPKMPRS
jgi:hypothetical protein